MRNSDIKRQARQIIGIIAAKLDHELISNRFDEPIARVAEEFKYDAEYPVTHKDFHKIIADFVQQIYEKALKTSWMLTDPLDEAILLLENGYRSPLYGPGYTGAILHANDRPSGGVQAVLRGLADVIRDVEQQKYINGVLTWHLHGCSWQLQCEIAQILLDDFGPFIPPQLCRYAAAQLVDVIPEILCACISSDFALQGISFGGQEPGGADRLLGREMLQMSSPLHVRCFGDNGVE